MKKNYFFSLLLVLSPTLAFARQMLRVSIYTPGDLITNDVSGAPGQVYVTLDTPSGPRRLYAFSRPSSLKFGLARRELRAHDLIQEKTIHYYSFDLHTRPDRSSVYYQIFLVEKNKKCLFYEMDTKSGLRVRAGLSLRVLFTQRKDRSPSRSKSGEGSPHSSRRAHRPITLCVENPDNGVNPRLNITFSRIMNNSLLPIAFSPITNFSKDTGVGTKVYLPTWSVLS